MTFFLTCDFFWPDIKRKKGNFIYLLLLFENFVFIKKREGRKMNIFSTSFANVMMIQVDLYGFEKKVQQNPPI